jgi:Cohesin domain
MPVRMRKVLLFGSLAVIVGHLLLDQAARTPGNPVAENERAAPPTATKAPPAERLELLEGRGLSRTQGELFRAPPPPARAAKKSQPAPVAAPPVAPPVPYRFAGKILKGSEEEVLVSKGDIVLPVKVGDILDGTYKVESIGGERIEVVYLPLGTRDRIAVSSALDAEPPTPLAAAATPAPAAPAAPAAASASGAASSGPAQLRWDGPERVAAGESFSVALRVSTSEQLRAAPMQLRFAPDVLQPLNVRPGKFFGEGSFSYRVNTEGSIFVGASSSAAAAGEDAELVVVTFRPIKRGTTAELSMGSLSLQGASGRAIAHEQLSAFRTAIQ